MNNMNNNNNNANNNKEADFDVRDFFHDCNEPMFSPQLIHLLLSQQDGNRCLESIIFLSWAIFYYYGLWDDATRALIKNIGKRAIGYEKSVLPWITEAEVAKRRWYPDGITKANTLLLLRQLYDYWFKKTILPVMFSVEKANGKGLHLVSRYIGGIRLSDVFDAENPGILIPLKKSFFNKLKKEMFFDSIYEVRKEDPNNYRCYFQGYDHFALIGPQSLMNHDNYSHARLMHIEDNSRSFLMEFKFHQYEHKFSATEEDSAITLNSYSPLKVSQQALPDGRLTQEEINDDRQHCERKWALTRNFRENVDKLLWRSVVRATFIKDLTGRRYQLGEELVIKYNDREMMGRKSNIRLRDHIIKSLDAESIEAKRLRPIIIVDESDKE
jgi:hypothetical protein